VTDFGAVGDHFEPDRCLAARLRHIGRAIGLQFDAQELEAARDIAAGVAMHAKQQATARRHPDFFLARCAGRTTPASLHPSQVGRRLRRPAGQRQEPGR
jgi:hypothetical protein